MNLYTAEVVSKKDLAPDILELHVRLLEPNSMSFKAGQCLGFHIEADKKKRLYSISSTPNSPNELEFCVDYSPMGEGSKFILGLKPGDKIVLEGPYGGFTADLAADKNLLFVATGVGIAPFKSLIKYLLENNYKQQITLLWGNRSEENFYWHEFFKTLGLQFPNFRYIPALSQPRREGFAYPGRVTKYLDEYISDYLTSTPYICGSPQMVKDVRAQLIQSGFTARDIKIEIFT